MKQSEDLTQKLYNLVENSGFISSNKFMENLEVILPDHLKVMHNSFALMASLEIENDSDEEASINKLALANTQSKSWLRDTLIKLENEYGLLIDGYLIFLLKNSPTEKLKEEARKIEQDSAICRKHVVWQSGDTDNLHFITFLKLPPSPSGIVQLESDVELSEEANFVLETYKEVKSLDRLMEIIRGQKNADK